MDYSTLTIDMVRICCNQFKILSFVKQVPKSFVGWNCIKFFVTCKSRDCVDWIVFNTVGKFCWDAFNCPSLRASAYDVAEVIIWHLAEWKSKFGSGTKNNTIAQILYNSIDFLQLTSWSGNLMLKNNWTVSGYEIPLLPLQLPCKICTFSISFCECKTFITSDQITHFIINSWD